MRLRRSLCVFIAIVMLASSLEIPAYAAVKKTLVVEQAQAIAVSLDSAIKKKNNEIVIKKMKYVEAVEAIKAKVKNIRSFRWTPLLSFKLPQKLDLVEEYDLNVKPMTLQAELTTLQHERDDLVYECLRRVGKLFTDIFIYQERITFTEEILAALRTDIRRNEAKLFLGTATQADIDTMNKAAEKLESDLALLKRSFQNAKAELSDVIKLDVTTGYTFKNPLKTADISREQLEGLVDYTLEKDHTYYATRMMESVALLNFDSYEELFRSQYGSKVDVITVFLNQARRGEDIDTTAFKEAYAAMLKSFDKPWDGRVKIIFFTFTMEWLKFQLSGTRYVEDEMYALYTAALEYKSARKDSENAEKALRKQIAAEYEALITAKNSVDEMFKILKTTKQALDRVLELNRQGRAEYGEVKDKQDDYQSQQLDAVDALATYNELLMDFDRLTCGGVTKLLSGAGLELDSGAGGDSNVDLPTYHIYTDVANLVFVFGVNIPEDYEPEIDAYELWYEDTRIGVRTPVSDELRHLALDYGETSMLTVRLYNGDEYVDECIIDTTIPMDILKLRGGVKAAPEERIVGHYTVTTEQRDGISTSEIAFTLNEGEPAKFYRISYDGVGVFTGEQVPIDKPFKYLSLLIVSAEAAMVEFYDENANAVYTARFEPSDQSLRVSAS